MPGRTDAAVSALAAAALWGGMYVVSKDTFAAVPPLTLGALRLLIAGATLLVVLGATGRLRRPPRDRRLLLASSALAATIIVQFLGTELGTASEAALLTTTTPLFLVPLAWMVLRERPSLLTVAGIGAGMIGVALAVQGGAGIRASAWGPALLLSSALLWAVYTIASARSARSDGPLVTVTWATLGATPPLIVASLFEVDRWRPEVLGHLPTVGAVLYLGVAASAGAWYLWNRGVAGLPAAAAGAFFFAQPLVGGLLAWWMLGERPTARFTAGGVLILAGVLLAVRGTGPSEEGL